MDEERQSFIVRDECGEEAEKTGFVTYTASIKDALREERTSLTVDAAAAAMRSGMRTLVACHAWGPLMEVLAAGNLQVKYRPASERTAQQ